MRGSDEWVGSEWESKWGLVASGLSSPFTITVIPAALDVGNTLNYTYEIAADREHQLPVAYAGEKNLWQFVARDAFGNIRLDNDTIVVGIAEVDGGHPYDAQPPSAASERVFSLLEAMLGNDQDASLSDMLQGALMLRYNKRTVG